MAKKSTGEKKNVTNRNKQFRCSTALITYIDVFTMNEIMQFLHSG